MKKLAAILLFLATPLAFAHNCPKQMSEIDQKISTAQGLGKEKMARVKKLRADGERLHKEGKHDESMKALGEAKEILKG